MAPVTVQIYPGVGLKYSGDPGGTPSPLLIRVLIIVSFRRRMEGMDVLVNGVVAPACFGRELATTQGTGDDGDGHLRQ